MSSEEPIVETTASTVENGDGESTEKDLANGAALEPEPEKIPEESPVEQEGKEPEKLLEEIPVGQEEKDTPANDAEHEQPQVDNGPSESKEGDAEEDGYEPEPENWDDFVVLDEADCTDGEDDEEEDEDAMQWDCSLEHLAPRTYTDAQLEPTVLDPRCKADWPLAGYWPVYVGNFRLYPKYDSDYNCFHAVHRYFASKGLPSFMVYRLKDSFYEEYQKRVGFYDMLVYFCNEKDASRAIQWCHRDLYYGHRLNVFCGRTLDMFPSKRSFRFKHKKIEDKLETETNLERYLNRHGKIVCITKQRLNTVLVQYTKSMPPSRSINDPVVLAYKMHKPLPKQRFVEADVEKELAEEIAQNPKFMRSRVAYKLLKSIKHGVIPQMVRPWERHELDESVIEERRQVRQKNPFHVNERGHFKRRHDDFVDDGPLPKSRRQLIREAQSLEHQLMSIRSAIDARRVLPPLPVIPRHKDVPKAAAANNGSEPAEKPKRVKTETQILRLRARGARRVRNRFRRDLTDVLD